MIKKFIFISSFLCFYQSFATAPQTDYLTLQGFDIAARNGYQGSNQTIAIISDVPNVKHTAFKDAKISIYDVTRHPKPLIGEDKSTFRYDAALASDPYSVYEFARSYRLHFHGNHVIGLINGQKGTYQSAGKDVQFYGGVAPKAHVMSFCTSPVRFKSLARRYTKDEAIAVVSYEEALLSAITKDAGTVAELSTTMDKEEFDRFPPEVSKILKERKVDDSLLDVFRYVSTQKNISAMSASVDLLPLMDPDQEYKIPLDVLNLIGQSLVDGDLPLVIAGGNETLKDLSKASSNARSLFKQFAAHPQIGPRFLIGINAQPDIKDYDNKYYDRHPTIVTLPTVGKKEISLYYSTNVPGEELWSYAVSAFGAHNLSAWHDNRDEAKTFSIESGTSEAVPQIAGLCGLIKEKYPHFNAIQIVDHVKKTVSGVSEEMRQYYGWGVINAAQALGLLPLSTHQ